MPTLNHWGAEETDASVSPSGHNKFKLTVVEGTLTIATHCCEVIVR